MLYTLLLHGLGSPLLQEHVAGIVQQEKQGNAYLIDQIFLFVWQANSPVRTRHTSHLDKWKCGVMHKWPGFVQFGLVLLTLVLGFAFIIPWGY